MSRPENRNSIKANIISITDGVANVYFQNKVNIHKSKRIKSDLKKFVKIRANKCEIEPHQLPFASIYPTNPKYFHKNIENWGD